MNILLITPDLPYPSESGVALRSVGILRGLRSARHQVSLLTFASDTSAGYDNPLSDWCRNLQLVPMPAHSRRKRLTKLLFSGEADMQHRLASDTFENALEWALVEGRYDIIQFFGIEFGRYLPLMRALCRGAKIVYDAQNAEADLQQTIANIDRKSPSRWHAALYSTIQARRLRRFEGEICREVDLVVAVSDEDADFLPGYNGAPLHVVPNGIQTRDYRPPRRNLRSPVQIVFSGKMDYRPNVDAMQWFCGDILPRVHERLPDTQLVIAGRNPHPRVQALANERVAVTGWVKSVQPHLHSSALYVVPLRMGSGTRLKILQALASGCPVVSTSVGAAGLNDETLDAIHIADDADAFADAVVKLLNDEEARERIGKQGMASVRKHYDWKALMPRLLDAYRSV